jgi:transcription termination/antitermination protein NusG
MLDDEQTSRRDADDAPPTEEEVAPPQPAQEAAQEDESETRPVEEEDATPVVVEEDRAAPPVEEAPIAGEGLQPAEPEEQEEAADVAEAEVLEAQEALEPKAPTEAPEAPTAPPDEPEPVAEPVEMPADEGVQSADPAAGVPAPTPETPAEVDASGDGGPAVDVPAAEAAPEEAPAAAGDPFSGPGDWYVIHTYAGYENKVKTNLGSRIHTMQMEDKIFDVVIPMEDVMEIKGGRKQVVQKKVFPGYLLVKMIYDDDSWYVVRNTPGVTGFVSSGTGQKPTPLSRREVEKILTVREEEAKKPAFRLEFEEGDTVRIISGPFADFTGSISEINVDQSKLKVLVSIFDRETPVELGFDQVARV